MSSGDPFERQSLTLQCDITGGNPTTGKTYKWRRANNEEAETGPQLIIPQLQIDKHSAIYSCAADHGLGLGPYGSPLEITVMRSKLCGESVKNGIAEVEPFIITSFLMFFLSPSFEYDWSQYSYFLIFINLFFFFLCLNYSYNISRNFQLTMNIGVLYPCDTW